ncbi:MAG: CDP-alcohol phosphatidyltransferase family protein [Proteobacteria bacterium]|jgi:phosphatidylglycerophosphate synthase|nr:CDP-alcohol phosphatidyltransferase family protein [Pseudomonadota bacterium]
MSTQTQTAIIICPAGPPAATVGRRLAGLTVGERLLLALSFSFVERALLTGPGARPSSDRAEIELFEAEGEALDPAARYVVLPADLVFDRRLLAEPEAIPPDLPIRVVDAAGAEEVLADPDAWLGRLGDSVREGKGRGYALRVVDRGKARAAERHLLESLKKPVDGFVSRHLNRKISLFISRFLVRTGVRPNAVTVAIMAFGALSGVFAAIAEPWWALVIAGLLFQTQSVLDGCDGEIARLTYRFSYSGQWLDTIGDDLTNYLFCLGLAVGGARVHGWPWLYAVGAFFFALQCYASGIQYQRILRMGTGDLLAMPNAVTGGQPRGAWGKFTRFVHTMTKRDTFVFVTAVIAAAQLPLVSFGLIAGGTIILAAGLTLNELRLREMERRGVPLPR